jgi:hypothetical protein
VSGPMQWTAGGLVPAIGVVPNAGETKPGAVSEGFVVVSDPELVERVLRKPAPKPAPKNVLALAKARLREVKTELRRLKALEKEKGELERLIAAAENKPRKPNIRAI